jgi:FAD:protein FMN transferase
VIGLDPRAGRRPPGVFFDLPGAEAVETFPCFGGQCAVLVIGRGPAGTAREAALRSKRRLLGWHGQFSRFEADSELCRLNRNPRETVAVSEDMQRFIESSLTAAEMSGGLVDPTLVAAIERAGYREHFESAAVPLARALDLAPPRSSGSASPTTCWRKVKVDRDAGTVTRPPGLQLDSGGVAKGLFGDLLSLELAAHESFAVNAAGDLRFGGTAALVRPVQVASPFDDSVLHVFELREGAAATSGIGRRSWLDDEGRPAHHLLDPGTGVPAFTGVVQVTALAPSAVQAEALSKAALLSGPEGALEWLSHGGAVVYDDGTIVVVQPPRATARLTAGAANSLQ